MKKKQNNKRKGKKYYDGSIRCDNCINRNHIKIPLGMLKVDFMKVTNLKCKYCGCDLK